MRLTLTSGRHVSLASLKQWRTYGGMLAGRPDAAINEAHIEDLLEEARRYTVAGGEPMMVQPKVTTAGRPGKEHLPGITCIAVFESGELAREDSEPYSSLTVAWFQDAFALPIDPDVEAQVRAVDWEAAAKDWMP